jgi:hypothetical protein
LSVSTWCEEHLVIPPPQTQSPGPFSLFAREYLREPLDTFSDPYVTDLVLCFGSQSGKTQMLMSGIAWTIACDPAGILWVMPSRDVAKEVAETRWLPIVRGTPVLAQLIPSGGNRRHDFRKLQQHLGASVIHFVGSNSPANLASRPARVVVMDETDKFPKEQKTEANAVALAEQRTKSFALPKKIKCSTPTLTDGIIWQAFGQGDGRRYHVPCPHCGKEVLLAWSAAYTVLSRTGNEAWIRWDKEAKRADGSWDLDRVNASARCECPHCGGHIRENHKTVMLRAGVWRAVHGLPGAYPVRSYHLPSLYAATPQTTLGALAMKFLSDKRSMLGLQAFINGELAEPWENQEARSERVELIAPPDSPPLPDSVPLMTVDVQAVSPYFWFIVRAWDKAGNSRLIAAGHCDEWESLRRVQLDLAIENHHVLVDAGFRSSEVYERCLSWAKQVPRPGGLPLSVGWTPSKGRERNVQWVDIHGKRPSPWFYGRAALPPSQRIHLPLLEFNGDFVLDILTRLRRGPEAAAGLRWELCPLPTMVQVDGTIMATEDLYFRHLDAKLRKAFAIGRTGRVEFRWVLRSQKWPDHLLDCELQQIVWAMAHKRFSLAARVATTEQLVQGPTSEA